IVLLPRRLFARTLLLLCLTTALFGLTGCTKKPAGQKPVDLKLKVNVPFRFVAYGDTRFHDPTDTEAANPPVRVTLVHAIAEVNPAFVCFTGDIVYNGYDVNDWKTWDSETSIWRDKNIPIFPALGNHDLHGDEKIALGNYFQRFPALKNSRYYSVMAANTLTLVLDSSLDEAGGPQDQFAQQTGQHPIGCGLRLPYVSPSALHQLLRRAEVRRRTFCPINGTTTGEDARGPASSRPRPLRGL